MGRPVHGWLGRPVCCRPARLSCCNGTPRRLRALQLMLKQIWRCLTSIRLWRVVVTSYARVVRVYV